jgi:branched-chain amino acid aminotransferase
VTTTGPLVWIDGEVLDAGHARVSANDHGLLLGDGCFETLAVTDGRPRLLERHLRRLRRALSLLEISGVPSDEQLRAAIDELVAAHGTDAARVRVTVTPGPGAPVRKAMVQEPWRGYCTSTALRKAWPLGERMVSETCLTLE